MVALGHTDEAVVMGQGGAVTQHIVVKFWYVIERNYIGWLDCTPTCSVAMLVP